VSPSTKLSVVRMAQSLPDPDARRHLAEGILAWLHGNVAKFDPPQEDAIVDTSPERVTPGARRKAFGELGLALYLAQRVPELRTRPEVRGLTEAWLAMARNRRIFFDARRRIHLVPLMAVSLTIMAAFGEMDREARQALQTVLDRGFLDRTERSAWTQTDIAYYLDALHLKHRFPPPATLFRRSSLIEPPALPHALRMDLYATTHLIFHLSDFGRRPLPGATPDEVAQIGNYCALALAMCLAGQDWDLVGEFAAARTCLGADHDALNEAAIAGLAGVQDRSGFIPNGSAPGAAEAEEEADRHFLSVYHPTLVALVMLACARAPQPSSPAAVQ
jgi:hypothetical protein